MITVKPSAKKKKKKKERKKENKKERLGTNGRTFSQNRSDIVFNKRTMSRKRTERNFAKPQALEITTPIHHYASPMTQLNRTKQKEKIISCSCASMQKELMFERLICLQRIFRRTESAFPEGHYIHILSFPAERTVPIGL